MIKKKPTYIYKAFIINVVDGDTFDAIVDMGFKMTTEQRFRVIGMDAPEIHTPTCKAELEHGLLARKIATEMLQDKEVTIHIFKEPSVYNRYSAMVTLPDGSDFRENMFKADMFKLDKYPKDKEDTDEGDTK